VPDQALKERIIIIILRNHGTRRPVDVNSIHIYNNPFGSRLSPPSNVQRSLLLAIPNIIENSLSLSRSFHVMVIGTLRRSPQYLSRPLGKRACSSPFHIGRTLATVPPEPARVVVGIRREDPSRIWERRCPVTPDEVAQLVQHLDVDVLIQDCDRRVFPTDQFIRVSCHHLIFLPSRAFVIPHLSPHGTSDFHLLHINLRILFCGAGLLLMRPISGWR